MSTYSKINFVYRLQKWMDSVPGQTFLNYAYSWGASIVILGTLFKLTHLPGANLMLFIGMGTEVIVFFLSAFDRPFDKTADGMELPTHVPGVFDEQSEVSVSKEETSHEHVKELYVGSEEPTQKLVLPTHSKKLDDAQEQYIQELNSLAETLHKMNEQSSRLISNAEEIENLNRTLTGISRVYEMQLKGASQQMGTIDKINEQTKMMAEQIEQLNNVYARMIEAMTINMRATAPNA